jgi:amino acid transporter
VILPLTFIFLIVVGLQVGLGSNIVTPSFAPFGYGVIFTALPATGIVYAYQGFRQPIDMAADARNPGKDIWRAILLEVVTSIIFYTFLQVGFIFGIKWNNSVVGTSGITPGSWHSLSTSLFTSTFPLFYVSLGLGLLFIAVLLIIGGVLGPTAETNQSTAAGSRIIYGMANEKILPKSFAIVHGKYRIPTLGVITMFSVTIFFMIMGLIGYLVSSVGAAWTALVSIITSTTIFAYMTGPISAGIIHEKYPELARPFKLRGLKIFVILATVISGLIVYWGVGSLYTPKEPYAPYILLGSMIIVPFVLWLTSESRSKNLWKDLKGSSWMIIYIIAIGFFVRFGEFGTNSLPLPYDWIGVIILSVLMYYLASWTSLPKDEIKKLVDESLARKE